MAVLFFIPLLYTQSRSSYIAIIPAMISFLFLSEKKIIVLSSIFFAGLIFLFLTPDVAKKRINYTFIQGQNRADVVEVGGVKLDTSTSDRIKSWYAASKDWMKEPLLGYGVTGYRFVDAQYIRVLVETGVIGLLAFLLLVRTIYKMAYKNFLAAHTSFNRGLAMGFIAGFTGLLFHALGANTFIIVRIMEPFWFVTGIVVLISQVEDKEQPGYIEKGKEKQKPTGRDRITFLSR
ncbi:O-antigen ligase family protein [Thermodesulfobacteriota bacterium]